jgi:hypothetical protein
VVHEPIRTATSLSERVQVVEDFAGIASRLLTVGDLSWEAAEKDYRLLGINSALRRQLESIRAAVLLAKQDLGHLAISFVRASLEDVIYLAFFVSLDLEDSQRLFKVMGSWDVVRSLMAQRNYVGDEAMKTLWYTPEFLQAGRANPRSGPGRLKGSAEAISMARRRPSCE